MAEGFGLHALFFSDVLVGESVKWVRMREAKGKITAWLESPVNQNLPPK